MQRRTRDSAKKEVKAVMKTMAPKDPSRMKEDGTSALMAYPFLRPAGGEVRLPDGTTVKALKLHGTVGMKYKQKEYFIPCAFYLTEDYPRRGPLAYVCPTQTMVVKAQHMHVDQNGLCYLPYLHEWNKKTSTMVGCVEALAEVFGRDPFVYSRPANPPAQPPAGQPGQLGQPPYATNTPPYMRPPDYGTQQLPYMTGGGGAVVAGIPVTNPLPNPSLGVAAAAIGGGPAARKLSVADSSDPNALKDQLMELQTKLEEEKTCSVCMVGQKDALIVPCGHVTVCTPCANELKSRNQPCPICRGPIQQLFKAYVV